MTGGEIRQMNEIFETKTFGELTTDQLYEIMRARAKVFVGEEKILYPDADGLDYQCLHVFSLNEEGAVESYLRMYRAESNPDAVQLGRVLTIHHGQGTGSKLMHYAEKTATEKLGAKEICMDAQKTAEGFYKKLGYEIVSDDFIEAGIMHVKMRKKLN